MGLIGRILLIPVALIGLVFPIVLMLFWSLFMVLLAPIVLVFGKRTIENGKIVYKL